MARPLRIEFSGALYHITSRGNARQRIYSDDSDRANFLEYLSHCCQRHDWLCHSYCLMTNHYHLLIETNNSTLSRGMKYLNGSYTQSYNRRHARVGHLFQGRYKAILVEKDAYLLELSRYIVLNPVRAKMTRTAKDWSWSSYRAAVGLAEKPQFLTTDWILAGFGSDRQTAQKSYGRFVSQGRGVTSPMEDLRNQIYLGSERFVEEMQCKMPVDQSLDDIPAPQRLSPKKPLSFFSGQFSIRNEAMARAYFSGHYTLRQVGEFFGVSYATVSRAVKSYECEM